MKTALLTSLAIISLNLSACTTVPDPAKVCTAEWIAPRAERAMNDFERDTKKIFKTFRTSADRLNDGGQIGPLQMFKLMNSLSSLANKFENGRAMRDMRTLANTCDDPKLIKDAMTDFMRKKGISDQFINFINGIEEYKKLLETGKHPEMQI